ncbi:S8 family serine peptidase [Gracilibacillus sp. YIM 98692]|uniref:S8 family serine peptidase n=1 Tax=Gracilibacillus sp. YIM 98692 TaxID=2663532 RepID=UPI0013D8A843|nr:S8 family serine peptidase [Gracilibacillus sp. YIM 98692]
MKWLIVAAMLFSTISIQPSESEDISLIVETEDNPHAFAEQIETYHPRMEILAVYDTIFDGVAVKGDRRAIEQLKEDNSWKQSYPVHTYQAIEVEPINKSIPFFLSKELPYTGKGVKVGVIDTGIDYTHPDLQHSYQGGYDLVDFDADPMETTIEQGMPTSHGTHVAGIIAANGSMQGIAKDAELYAYRALGPGGSGSSVQVMAAIEQAVKDGMDVINLSLGNTINGPDWPTSVAVNRATEQGVTVVIANGNTGPEPWTVGSPATASSVISVGASTPLLKQPYLYDRFSEKKVEILSLVGSSNWAFEGDLKVLHEDNAPKQLPMDTILVMDRGTVPFAQLAIKADEMGAKALLIANKEEGVFQGALEANVDIPVAAISKEDGEWLKQADRTYLQVEHQEIKDTVTEFSSRGPVTVNWMIKPEVVAPGAAIMSTVPGGYQALSGTSMASPHVAGAAALLKEAHPNWTPKQIKAALITTADPFQQFLPNEQGAGKVVVDEALKADTLLYDSFIHFGKVEDISEYKEATITVENVSEKEKRYAFKQPEQKQSIRWKLPKSFSLAPGEKREVTVEATIRHHQIEEPFVQGYLQLNDFSLPYLFLTEDTPLPKAMGLEFALEPLDDAYQYQFYLTEEAESVTVDLYDPYTFAFQQTLLQLESPEQGVVKGKIEKDAVHEKGMFLANITVEFADDVFQYQTMLEVYGQN